jgi:hypothetical protein
VHCIEDNSVKARTAAAAADGARRRESRLLHVVKLLGDGGACLPKVHLRDASQLEQNALGLLPLHSTARDEPLGGLDEHPSQENLDDRGDADATEDVERPEPVGP